MKLLFNFEKPANYSLKVFIWLFIIAINVVINLLEEPLAGLNYRGWAFWLVNISFFLMEHESSYIKRIIKIALGACTGCLLAFGTIALYANVLAPVMGHVGLLIPIAISLAFVILAGPFFPALFNGVTFMYFVCSSIVAAEAATNVFSNCGWALAGSLIMNGGCFLIITAFTKHKMKKAMAAAAAAQAQ